MPSILISKSNPLKGKVKISGAKNAVLPILASTLLASGVFEIESVPNLKDVQIMKQLLESLGAKIEYVDEKMTIDTTLIHSFSCSYELVRKMRASFLVMGPLLAKFKKGKIYMPGGCAIGTRPIDLHIKGFETMGAKVFMDHGEIKMDAKDLFGGIVYLDFPSVGATENLMMAASLAKGKTIIENAAQEPEIVDLANFLSAMGAKIVGAGTNTIVIKGVGELKACQYRVIPDRIEAGTYMVASAITGGDIVVENVIPLHLKPITAKLREMGCKIEEFDDSIRVLATKNLKPIKIKTLPHPGFPTDMQSQFMALMTQCDGVGTITETVFENRFMHVQELRKMGANIHVDGKMAVLKGRDNLQGAKVKASDLRAGAALVLAGLVANGMTQVLDIYHIQRGYTDIVAKFSSLGANIKLIDDNN